MNVPNSLFFLNSSVIFFNRLPFHRVQFVVSMRYRHVTQFNGSAGLSYCANAIRASLGLAHLLPPCFGYYSPPNPSTGRVGV